MHKYLGESSSATSSIGIGKLQTCIFNGDDTFPALVSLTDYIPSTIIYPLLHTTEIWLHRGTCAGDFTTFPLCLDQEASDALVKPTYNSTKINFASSSNDYVSEYQFVTSPTSGATLELKVQLPPDSSMCISMEYNYRFLPFDAFPSDPNRGLNIPPSFAQFSCPTCSVATPSTTLFTSSLLLLPPTPDMTMPFNVISLTTTVYAFIIGSVMNILIRRSSASINKALGKREADVKSKIKVILTNLKEKIIRLLLSKRKRKVKDE
jgi:phosphatidylinositol glycan class T